MANRKCNGLVLLTLGCIIASCSVGRRIDKAYSKDGLINIRQPNNKEKKADTASFVPITAKIKDKDGVIQNVAQTSKDKNGEDIASFALGEVEVVAKSKIVPERNGLITIGFVINVPSSYIQDDWRIIVNPVLYNNGERCDLDPVAVTGESFGIIEDRERHLKSKRWEADIKKTRLISLRNKEFNPFLYRDDKSVQNKENDFRSWENSLNRSWRLDTMIQEKAMVSYFYKHELVTEGMGKNVKLYINPELESIDGKRYTLSRGDTLIYVISSMTQFMDRSPRYVREISLRKITENLKAFIYFPVGKTTVVDTLLNGKNKEEIDKVRLKMDEINNGNIFIVDSIGILANCSPEGNWLINKNLAEGRAKALHKYMEPILSTNAEAINLVKSRIAGENWNELTSILKKSDLINADAIIKVIKETENPDEKERRIAELFPMEYGIIRDKYYPLLRNVDFTFYLSRKGMVEDTIYTNVIDTAYANAITLLENRKYKEALPKLIEYRDINSAICYMSLGYNSTAVNILLEQPISAERDYMLAILYARLGMNETAVNLFKSSVKMDPSKLQRGELDPEISKLIKENDLEYLYDDDYL